MTHRSHQRVEYLLDPILWATTATYDEREQRLPYRIVHGDECFADHARGVQGIPWRCSTTTFLHHAADHIDAFDTAAARRQFSTATMVDAGVYQARHGDDDEPFDELWQTACRTASYYRHIADSGLDLIFCCD